MLIWLSEMILAQNKKQFAQSGERQSKAQHLQ
jgi:hypothetical protein